MRGRRKLAVRLGNFENTYETTRNNKAGQMIRKKYFQVVGLIRITHIFTAMAMPFTIIRE